MIKMKKRELKRIIKEEVENLFEESSTEDKIRWKVNGIFEEYLKKYNQGDIHTILLNIQLKINNYFQDLEKQAFYDMLSSDEENQ